MNRTYTQTILALGSLIAVVGSGCNAAKTAATEAAATVTLEALADGSWSLSDCAGGSAKMTVTSSGGTITLTTHIYADEATCTADGTADVIFASSVTASVGTEDIALQSTTAKLLTATTVSTIIIPGTASGATMVSTMCPSASFSVGGITDVSGQTCNDEGEFVFPSVGDTVYTYVAISDSTLHMRRTGLGPMFGAADASLVDVIDFDNSETFIAQ